MSKRKVSEDYLIGIKCLIDNAKTTEERERLISQLGKKMSQSVAPKKSEVQAEDSKAKKTAPGNNKSNKPTAKKNGSSKKSIISDKEMNLTTFATKTTSTVPETIKQENPNAKNKGKNVAVKRCSNDCKPGGPGATSECTIRSGLKVEDALSCRDVHDILKKMGVKDVTNTSRCIRAAIMRKFINITGDKSDLDKVIFRSKAKCGHVFGATLRQLLYQPDHPKDVDKREHKLKCQYASCTGGDMSIYVAGLCVEDARVTDGKLLHHCVGCPAFGRCLFDIRKSHYDVSGKHTNL